MIELTKEEKIEVVKNRIMRSDGTVSLSALAKFLFEEFIEKDKKI